MKKTPRAITALILLGVLSSCQDDGMLIAQVLPTGPSASELAADRSEQAAQLEQKAVQDILRNNCSACHGPDADIPHGLSPDVERFEGVLDDVEDIEALVGGGYIIPGVPEESRLLVLMATGQMPPRVSGLPRVSEEEVRQVELFILRLNPPTQSEVQQILLRSCGGCHDNPRGSVALPINDIDNIEVLVAARLIVPGDRDRSMVYQRIAGGSMPPANSGVPPMSERDLARLGGFIDLLP